MKVEKERDTDSGSLELCSRLYLLDNNVTSWCSAKSDDNDDGHGRSEKGANIAANGVCY